MDYDYSKRGYLLPPGCKDLIDVQKIKWEKTLQEWRERDQQRRPAPKPLPPVAGEIVVPEHTTVSTLATLLSQKPFQIIADLMEVGVFAHIHRELDFETIAKVTRKYGLTAKRAA